MTPQPRHFSEIDPHFVPASLWTKEFLKACHRTPGSSTLAIGMSRPDGTAFSPRGDTTCRAWTSSSDEAGHTAVVGHSDAAPSLESWYGAPLPLDLPANTADIIALPFSSGTTGLSKGVELTHRSMLANLLQVGTAMEYGASDVLMGFLPFFHIYGQQVIMNTALAYGATVVTMPRFDLERYLQAHAQYGITLSFIAPPVAVLLAKHPAVGGVDFSKVRVIFSGAAPLAAEVAAEASARLGCPLVQGYGMTEMSPVSHLTPIGRDKPG